MDLCPKCKINSRGCSSSQTYCSSCANEYKREWKRRKKEGLATKTYHKLEGSWYERNKEQALSQLRDRRNCARDFVYSHLQEHPCVDCGESDIVVLEFDHLRDKVRNISQMIHRGQKIAAIAEEIAKCEVVCANCHKRRTAKTFGWKKLGSVCKPGEARAL